MENYINDDGFSNVVMKKLVAQKKIRLRLLMTFTVAGFVALALVFFNYGFQIDFVSLALWDLSTVLPLLRFLSIVGFICYLVSTELVREVN